MAGMSSAEVKESLGPELIKGPGAHQGTRSDEKDPELIKGGEEEEEGLHGEDSQETLVMDAEPDEPAAKRAKQTPS